MLSDISRSAVVQDLASEWSSAEAMVTTETGVDVLVLLWTLCSGLLATSCAEPLTDPLAKALRIVLLVTYCRQSWKSWLKVATTVWSASLECRSLIVDMNVLLVVVAVQLFLVLIAVERPVLVIVAVRDGRLLSAHHIVE